MTSPKDFVTSGEVFASARHFVFAAGEPEPRCPLAVVRVGADGTARAFTRELRWEPTDRPLGNAWEVNAEWAEVFLIDMVREMRRVRHGESADSVQRGVGAAAHGSAHRSGRGRGAAGSA